MERVLKNFFITIVFIFVTHYLMVLIHIHLHTLFAWAVGIFKNPFDINYLSISLFLVDKQSNFDIMFSTGHNVLTAINALLPNLANALLFITCLYFISSKKVQEKKYLYYFLYWFMIMNFGQVYSEIYRAFELPGDLQVFSKGLNISPYWIFIPGILFVIYGFSVILSYKIPQAYKVLKLLEVWKQAIFLFTSLLILFGYFGGLIYEIMNKAYSYLIYPISLTILFFIICYPTNRWVKNKMLKY